MKISVIVAVYNVEDYIENCVLSLLGQTYPNFDIILVNDGSTDGSSHICSLLADSHGNVRVLHKENGGLSSARNEGLKISDATYVTFVDGDDVVSPNYLETLARPLLEGRSDLSVVGLRRTGSQEKFMELGLERGTYEYFDSDSALVETLKSGKISVSACGKLASLANWAKHPFPVGRVYEDLATTVKVIGSANRIAVSSASLYGQIERLGSITRSAVTSKQLLDYEQSLTECTEYCVSRIIDSRVKAVRYRRLSEIIRMLRIIRQMPENTQEIRDLDQRLRVEFLTYWKSAAFSFDCPMSLRARVLIWRCSPRIYNWLFRSRQAHHASR